MLDLDFSNDTDEVLVGQPQKFYSTSLFNRRQSCHRFENGATSQFILPYLPLCGKLDISIHFKLYKNDDTDLLAFSSARRDDTKPERHFMVSLRENNLLFRSYNQGDQRELYTDLKIQYEKWTKLIIGFDQDLISIRDTLENQTYNYSSHELTRRCILPYGQINTRIYENNNSQTALVADIKRITVQ